MRRRSIRRTRTAVRVCSGKEINVLSSEIRQTYLVDELQLGDRLNTALQSSDRAQFDLLLSMLSKDLTDCAPFDTPQEQQVGDENLRKRFALPPAQAHYARSAHFEQSASLGELLSQGGQSAMFLSQCLNPEPLTPFERELSPEVFAELTPLQQEKFRRSAEGKVLEYERIKEAGAGFDVIAEVKESQEALVA